MERRRGVETDGSANFLVTNIWAGEAYLGIGFSGWLGKPTAAASDESGVMLIMKLMN